jgi:hypothetical protein
MLARFIALHCASAGKKFPTMTVPASGSHPTRRRREMDSNHRYPREGPTRRDNFIRLPAEARKRTSAVGDLNRAIWLAISAGPSPPRRQRPPGWGRTRAQKRRLSRRGPRVRISLPAAGSQVRTLPHGFGDAAPPASQTPPCGAKCLQRALFVLCHKTAVRRVRGHRPRRRFRP